MKKLIKASANLIENRSEGNIFMSPDGNTTNVYVGVKVGTRNPVYICAIYNENKPEEANDFYNKLLAAGSIDRAVDLVYYNYDSKKTVIWDEYGNDGMEY